MRKSRRRRALGLTLSLVALAVPLTCLAHSHGPGGPDPGWTVADQQALERFECWPPDRKDCKEVFALGEKEDAPVLLLHELPGLTPEALALAKRIAHHGKGYRVYLPLFFGEKGVRSVLTGYAKSIGPDFRCYASQEGRTRPVVEWIRGYADRILAMHPGRKLAVIGNCLTGGFPLELLDRDRVAVAVLSQPACPFPLSAGMKRSLGLATTDLAATLKARLVSPDKPFEILAFRFTHDGISPGERLQTLCELRAEIEAGSDHFAIEAIDSSPTNAHRLRESAHAVLTEELRDDACDPTWQALQKVFAALDRQLYPEHPPIPQPPAPGPCPDPFVSNPCASPADR